MNVYTYSEARQKLPELLEKARREGEIRIRRRDGAVFVLKPLKEKKRSPLDVGYVDLGLTVDEIVEFVHEGRRQGPGP